MFSLTRPSATATARGVRALSAAPAAAAQAPFLASKVTVTRTTAPRPHPKPAELVFGKFFSDHMLIAEHTTAAGARVPIVLPCFPRGGGGEGVALPAPPCWILGQGLVGLLAGWFLPPMAASFWPSITPLTSATLADTRGGGTGWAAPRIEPLHDLTLAPSALCLHYGLECFEGLKAFKGDDGHVRLFRPELNMQRLAKSCTRLTLPAADPAELQRAIADLVRVDKDWIPAGRGFSLYLRPTVIATQVRSLSGRRQWRQRGWLGER